MRALMGSGIVECSRGRKKDIYEKKTFTVEHDGRCPSNGGHKQVTGR